MDFTYKIVTQEWKKELLRKALNTDVRITPVHIDGQQYTIALYCRGEAFIVLYPNGYSRGTRIPLERLPYCTAIKKYTGGI